MSKFCDKRMREIRFGIKLCLGKQNNFFVR